MSEKEAKKIFLKQAKPFFKRYEAETARKNARQRRSFDFHAIVELGPVPCFAAKYEDLFRGVVSMRVPILFTLPLGFEKGFKFTDAATLANFKKYCEGV